jgi:creatinine amidohydrolase
LTAGALAVLPVGAGAKEHGLHLPMGTDALQAEWLCDELAKRAAMAGIDLLVWPTVSYGYYPAFTAYAGSVTLSRPTFIAVMREIASGLQGFGARAVLVLDTGISTIAPVAESIGGLEGVHHLRIHAGPRYRKTAQEVTRQIYGSHADELETSRMLAILPGWVDMARAAASPVQAGGPGPGALTPDDPASLNYSPSGSFGDPTLATAEKGTALVEAMLDDLVLSLREIAGKAA